MNATTEPREKEDAPPIVPPGLPSSASYHRGRHKEFTNRGAPMQARFEHEVSKLLQILDEIQVETLRENSFEREASK